MINWDFSFHDNWLYSSRRTQPLDTILLVGSDNKAYLVPEDIARDVKPLVSKGHGLALDGAVVASDTVVDVEGWR